MHVVFFGTFDEEAHPRVRVLREGLAAHGADIRVCNRPLGVDTAARVRLASRPWLLAGFALRVLRAWRDLWRSGRGLDPDVVVVGYLGHLDVHLARRRFPAATLVLDHMVSLSGTLADRQLGGGVLRRAAAAVDRAALRAADLVVVDTEAHAADAAAACRRAPVVVPVGAPEAWFADVPAESATGRAAPSIVFFGLYTPLQGAATIAEALARLGSGTCRVTMVGTGQDRPAAEARLAGSGAEVTWVDWSTPAELAKLVASHDICLGIFGDTPKARRVVPNKVFQGAAAGCAVVTSDTDVQRSALGDGATYVPAADPGALADALAGLLADPDALLAARRRASARAAAFRPAAVVGDLVAALDADGPTVRAHAGPPAPLALNAQLRWAEVAPLLRRDRPGSILELGCGRGGFGSRFAAVARYTGVEPDDGSRAQAAEAVGGRVHASLDTVEDDGFDWLCSFEVLEHIDDDRGALQGWVQRLRPGGRVVVSVPAHQRRFGAADAAVGHLRRYDPDDLRALLAGAGLADVEVRAYGAGAGDVLEAGRNLLAARRPAPSEASAVERSAGSGRWMVLPGWVLRAAGLAMVPFVWLQRPLGRRGLGPGLIGTGVKP